MSWFVAVATISLAGCAFDDPDVSCGDDAVHEGGLSVSFEGREPATTYDFAIDAEGRSLVVTAPPGAPTDPVTVDLGDGRTLSAHMVDSSGSFLGIGILLPPPDPADQIERSHVGPMEVTVVARTGGAEVGRATYTPTYDRDYPWGMSCPFFDQEGVTMTLTAP